MADSYRLTVLRSLSRVLEGVVLDDGTPLTGNVFRGRATFGEESPDTMISVLEGTKPAIPDYVGNRDMRKAPWPLIIQGWTKNDKVNPTDPIYQMVAAVETRLARILEKDDNSDEIKYPEDYLLGSGGSGKKYLIAQAEFGPGVVSPPRDQVSTRAFFFMPIWLTLAETTGKPYFVP